MQYRGGCHCGQVAFEVEGTIEGAVTCNCSICQRKGMMMWFVPRASFRLITPEENSRVYTFNKHRIKHRFCPQCGIQVYAESTDKQGNPIAAVNVRCIEGIDLAAIPVKEFDGRSM
ncbi:GFA family protein [Silvimonas iriomotensis]|uniref:CENP-V/GFA domain-containing protein n=1 Tax=Silvimonas iriomotensis TaxID=449662 RepID=A0ABQ2PC70_9NEIS|nr:GFA family protein [Silvimonas iriomotensis]GGP22968.1 hypothetical protein GCM10010970_29680 [Silvimonas iriomotensis]